MPAVDEPAPRLRKQGILFIPDPNVLVSPFGDGRGAAELDGLGRVQEERVFPPFEIALGS